MSNATCQINTIHQEHVAAAQGTMPEEPLLLETAAMFSLLGEISRLRILHSLSVTELCVCDLAAILGTSSSAVSHQLRLLRAKGMVRFRRAGKIVYYTLADDHVRHLLTEMLAHLRERRTGPENR